jgi:hypothetical protein
MSDAEVDKLVAMVRQLPGEYQVYIARSLKLILEGKMDLEEFSKGLEAIFERRHKRKRK